MNIRNTFLFMNIACVIDFTAFSYTLTTPYNANNYMSNSIQGVPPDIPYRNLYVDYPKSIPNWYVVEESSVVVPNKPHKVELANSPIAIWKTPENQYAAISDVCPHRGASLSKGRIDSTRGCLVCPYHTFKYDKTGRLVQTPGQQSMRMNTNYNFKTDVPHYPVLEKNGWVYVLNKPLFDINELRYYNDPATIWTEPEATDDNYRCVQLRKRFNQDARTVTENSLDILHISEVHTFGNKKRPLPITEKLDKLAEGHYRYTYQYEAGEDSIPAKIFGINTLIVENEYVLPHTSVARVRFGNFVNTIVTSALPINDNETMLFVKAYRNNWVFNNPVMDMLFDKMTTNMMEKTLLEDKGVVDTIYAKFRDGNFITKYDELVRLYREDYASMVERH